MRSVLRSLGLTVSTAAFLVTTAAFAENMSINGPAATSISKIQRVSTSSTGKQANDSSWYPLFSPDNRNVGFVSRAKSLVPGSKGESHVYIKDIVTNRLRRVSETSAGTPGNGDSFDHFSFSPSGKKVLFASEAKNLVNGDTNISSDIFEKNLTTGAIRRLSTNSKGRQANDRSFYPIYSPDGKKIAFSSSATNLVAGDTNGEIDVFVKDLSTGVVTRVSKAANGKQGNDSSYAPVFSPNGARIAFSSWASNLVKGDITGPDLFVRSLEANDIAKVNVAQDGTQDAYFNSNGMAVWTPDSKNILFSTPDQRMVTKDTNNSDDIFSKNILTRRVVRLSITSTGGELNNSSFGPSYSKTGRYLAYVTGATNLASNDANGFYDIYVHDKILKVTRRVSTKVTGAEANGNSTEVSASRDGTKYAFTSDASNLVGGDTNATRDIFVATLK